MIDFRETMNSTFERGKLPKSWLFLSKNVPSSTFVVRTSPSYAVLTISICCPVTIGSDTSITTLLVFRSSCKLLFPLIYRIISKYLIFFLLFHPILYPGRKNHRYLLLEVRNSMKNHLARLLARACIPIWYVLIFRLHLEAFKYFKERISYHIILSACLPTNLKSIQMCWCKNCSEDRHSPLHPVLIIAFNVSTTLAPSSSIPSGLLSIPPLGPTSGTGLAHLTQINLSFFPLLSFFPNSSKGEPWYRGLVALGLSTSESST